MAGFSPEYGKKIIDKVEERTSPDAPTTPVNRGSPNIFWVRRAVLTGVLPFEGSTTATLIYGTSDDEAEDEITVWDWCLAAGEQLEEDTKIAVMVDPTCERYYVISFNVCPTEGD